MPALTASLWDTESRCNSHKNSTHHMQNTTQPQITTTTVQHPDAPHWCAIHHIVCLCACLLVFEGSQLRVDTGVWVGSDSSVGAGIDSFYEYLLKVSALQSADLWLGSAFLCMFLLLCRVFNSSWFSGHVCFLPSPSCCAVGWVDVMWSRLFRGIDTMLTGRFGLLFSGKWLPFNCSCMLYILVASTVTLNCLTLSVTPISLIDFRFCVVCSFVEFLLCLF